MSVNKVILVGNLGADPEVRSFPNGGMVANVNIATTERWNDRQSGERKEHTEWHRLQFSNRLAEIAQQYLRKGSKIYVEGSIRTNKWQDQNGQDRYSTEVRVQNMTMLDSNPNAVMGGQVGGQQMGQQMGGQMSGHNYNPNNNLNNQGQPQQQPYQNQANPNASNSFNQQPQAPQTQQQPPANPNAPAMVDAPVDDDIPF